MSSITHITPTNAVVFIIVLILLSTCIIAFRAKPDRKPLADFDGEAIPKTSVTVEMPEVKMPAEPVSETRPTWEQYLRMEQLCDAAISRAGKAEQRAEAMERRALAAEALRDSQLNQPSQKSPQDDLAQVVDELRDAQEQVRVKDDVLRRVNEKVEEIYRDGAIPDPQVQQIRHVFAGGGAPSIVYDREEVGKLVLETLNEWATKQSQPDSFFLTPWDELSETNKEMCRLVGERVAALRFDINPELKKLKLFYDDIVLFLGHDQVRGHINELEVRIRQLNERVLELESERESLGLILRDNSARAERLADKMRKVIELMHSHQGCSAIITAEAALAGHPAQAKCDAARQGGAS